MPVSSAIYELVKEGEGQHLDFKQSISSVHKIARTMAAFANSEGGRIVVGIDDSGEVVGVDVEQEKYMLIQAGKKYCEPSVFLRFTTLEERGKVVLIAEVKQGKGEYRALDESGEWHHYVRVEDQTVLVPDAIEQSHADKYNLKPIPIVVEEHQGLVDYLDKNDFITVKEYMKMMNISYTIARRSLNDLSEHGVLGIEFIKNVPHYFLKRKELL